MSKISLYLVFVLFIVKVLAVEIRRLPDADIEKNHETSKQCAAENGIDDPDILMRFQNYKLDLDNNPRDLKYAFCFMIRNGYMDDKGLFARDRVKEIPQGYKTDEFLAVIDKCNSLVTETDPEKAMIQILVCYGNDGPLQFYTDLP